jgi:hypothetical protein
MKGHTEAAQKQFTVSTVHLRRIFKSIQVNALNIFACFFLYIYEEYDGNISSDGV